MKLHKALKVKNRMVGEINRVKGLLQRDNSRKKEFFKPDLVRDNFDNLHKLTEELIDLKSKIQIATAPISDKLLRMAELKGMLSWYNSLSVKDGDFEVENYRTEKVRIEHWRAFFKQEDVDNELRSIQKQIENLQDEIDEYNATTEI